MKDQIIQLLRDFAAQIGTTVDKLWSVLVAQAHVAAVTNALFILSVLFAGLMAYWLYKRADKVALAFTKASDEKATAKEKAMNREPGYFDRQSYTAFDCMFCGEERAYSRNGIATAWVLCLVYFIIGIIGTVASAGPTMVTAMLNPEYWALSKILSLVK